MKHLEKIILLSVLLVIVGVLAYWALTFPDKPTLTNVAAASVQKGAVPVLKPEDLTTKLVDWTLPPTWNRPSNAHDLFVSQKYLFFPDQYPSGKYIRLVTSSVADSSGILLSWYKKYRIDFSDPNAAHEDPDHDGFSNYVEFFAHTDPSDPKDHPPYLSRLRIRAIEQKPFHIEFRGYQTLGGKHVFQIYLNDVDSEDQPPLKKEGEPLGTEGYVVGHFTENHVNVQISPGHTMPQDQSTLELIRPDINQTVLLHFGAETLAPEITADFNLLMPNERDQDIKVLVGKTFSLTYEPTVTYTLIKATPDGATIRNEATKQMIDVPKLDPKEWDWVPSSDGPGSTTPTTGTPDPNAPPTPPISH